MRNTSLKKAIFYLLLILPILSPLSSKAATTSCGPVYVSESTNTFFPRIYTLSGATATLFSATTAPTQNIATIAQGADGKIYFDNGASLTNFYSWNGTTTATVSTTLPNFTQSGPGGGWDGNIYYIGTNYHLISVAPAGIVTDLGAITAGNPTDAIFATMGAGDVASDANGRLYWYGSIPNGTSYLYRIDRYTLKATNLGNIGPLYASGAAFDAAGNLITTAIPATGVTQAYSINLSTFTATLQGTISGFTASGAIGYDLASCNLPTYNPIITTTKSVANITRSQNPAVTAYAGDILEYTITVTNTGNITSDLTTLSDSIPAGVSYLANSTTMNGIAVADIATKMPFDPSGTGTLLINSPAKLAGDLEVGAADASVIKFRVTVGSSGIPAAITNTATATYPTVTNGVTSYANHTSNPPTNVSTSQPDMTITKSHTGTWTQGDTGKTYTLTATNSGVAATGGAVTVTDTLPAGLTATAISGTGWTCTLGTVSCTRSDVLAAGSSYPPITVTVSVSTSAATSVTNTATVSNIGEPSDKTANNTATDVTAILKLPDLTLAKSHSGSFSMGSTGTYTFTASNIGNTTTSGTITVSDTLPTGLTVNNGAAGAVTLGGTNAANWTCNSNAASPQVITCTSSTTIAGGATSVFSFTPKVGIATAIGTNSITNTATISGGGDNVGTNNSASDPTTILAPNLTITKSHANDVLGFVRGGAGSYEITYGNSGTGATSGTITVSDSLPAGLTIPNGAVTLSGANAADWSCTAATNVITCTSAVSIAASGSGIFGFNVNVSAGAAASVTNTATISGGSEPAVNNGNNSSSNPTTTVAAPDLTITKTHAGNFSVGGSGTYALNVKNPGPGATIGTITVTDTLPVGLTVNSGAAGAVTLGGTNAANWSCTSNAASPQVITCTSSTAILGNITSVFNFNVSVGLNTAVGTNSVTNSVTMAGGNDSNALNNTATDPTTIISPDLTIAKSHVGNFSRGSTGSYTLTATNSGTDVTTGTITITDTLPTGLSVAAGALSITGTNAANWTCSAAGQVITCTSTNSIAIAGTSTFSFSVNVAAGAAASVTNSAAISGGTEATSKNGNNSTTDPTTTVIPADLTLTKSHAGNFTVGSTGSYSLSVNNGGGIASSGTITVTDTLPVGLTVNGGSAGTVTVGGANAANWSCNSNAASPQVITCTSNTAIAAAASSVFSFSVNVGTSTAVGTNSITNNATVSGGGEVLTTNNGATDQTTILSPDLTVAKSHVGSFVRGSTGSYSITATNGGTASTSGNLTIVDTLPTGLSVAAGSLSLTGTNAANWSCSATGQVITCTSSTALAIAGTSTFGFSVNVSTSAAASVTNAVSISGGSEATANNSNNSATDPTATLAPTDLTIAKGHTGSFTVGSTGSYQFTVSNSGDVASSGTITVSDTLPAGLTVNGGAAGAVTISGTNAANWSCISNALSPQTITCTSSTAIAGSGSSTFSVLASVGLSTAVGTNSITNTATVSGGGDTNATNNSGSDPTTVLSPDLTLAKSHTGTFTKGSSGSYTLTVSNTGTASTNGTITVTDTLPSGLSIAAGSVTLTGANAANWTCNAAGQIITCTSSTAIANGSNSVFAFAVNISQTAPNSVTNTASTSGGGEATANNLNNSASDITSLLALPPNVVLVKACTSPANCTSTPQNPGTDITYQIGFTNSGGQVAANMALVDAIPTFTVFKIGSATINSGTTGGTFVIEYSNDFVPANPSLATWTYTPVSGGGGASAGYDLNVKAIRWRESAGTLPFVAPDNTGSVSFVVKIK